MRPPDAPQLLRLTLVDDHPLSLPGLGAVLAGSDVRLVDPARAVGLPTPVDLVLYEPEALSAASRARVVSLVADGARPAVFTWRVPGSDAARTPGWPVPVVLGMGGLTVPWLSKRTAVDELVRQLRAVVGPGATDRRPRASARPTTAGGAARAFGLTPRERDVLRLIARGHSNDEIAAELHVSVNSVKTYVRSSYAKIGVDRRSRAVVWGVRHGLDVA